VKSTARPLIVILKALCLFLLINLIYGLINPAIADISVYNTIFAGLKRMPFGGDRFSVSMDNVDAMFAAHEISASKKSDEIRVVLIGDSSIWGEGLLLQDTLSEQWNRAGFQCNGKTIKVYNLGYPHPSVVKDLVFIDQLKTRKPDAIIWFVTLNTLLRQTGLNPFVTKNRAETLRVLDQYKLEPSFKKPLSEMKEGFYQKTLMGQRSFLARWTKLQFMSLIWTATGMDAAATPNETGQMSADVDDDLHYRTLTPESDFQKALLLDALLAGQGLASKTPLLLVNEPIYIASGVNSDVRYNNFYPRWAYDQYRDNVAQKAQNISLPYLDLWNTIPTKYFTDTPLHFNKVGEHLLMEQLNPALQSMVCK
jgi:hypothetical protein